MLPVMPTVHLKMNVAVITLPNSKNTDVAHHNQNSIHIDVAHHNQSNIHIDVTHHNTHVEVEVAHHNAHVEVAHHNTHVKVAHHNHIDVTHVVDVRIHLAVHLIANANLQDLFSHILIKLTFVLTTV